MKRDFAPQRLLPALIMLGKTRFPHLRSILIAAALVIITLSLYAQVVNHSFVILDDHKYVAMNANVQRGLTWNGLMWAFSSLTRSNWHPLTWLSHMMDVELFGMHAGYHHLVNAGFHALSSVLLFVVLNSMIGRPWVSAFTAALFAVHPLHVESVAWVAERKDVLSGLFFMLTLLAYARFVRSGTFSRYVLVLSAFAFGLMTKPMLVTVPAVLCLLDVWPLGRTRLVGPADGTPWNPVSWQRLAAEKVPLACLSAALAAVAIIAQSRTISSIDALPFSLRVSNALVSYVSYLAKTFWPFSLSVHYPYPASIPIGNAIGALLILLALSIVALRQIKRQPFLAVGWFWYLIMLLPVIGIVQVGRQAMADRYSYLPLIGIALAAACLASEWGARSRVRARLAAAFAGMALIALCAVTAVQIGYWKDGITLFSHALAVTDHNQQAEKGLAISLDEASRHAESIPHFLRALNMNYDDAEAHRDLAYAFISLGQRENAIRHLKEAVRLDPGNRVAQASLQHYLMNR